MGGPESWMGGGLQGIPRTGQRASQVDEIKYSLACWLCEGRVHQGNNSLCQHFCLGESNPLHAGLALMTDNSVPPLMSLLPFKLLPQCWSSEGVSWSKSMCGPFKRNYLGLQKPSISLSLNPQWFLQPGVFIASGYRDFSSWHWNPGLGGLVWGWGPSILMGVHPQLRYPSQFLSATPGCGTSPVCVSDPPTSLQVASLIP